MSNTRQDYIDFTFRQARRLGQMTALMGSLISLLESEHTIESYKDYVIDEAKKLLDEDNADEN